MPPELQSALARAALIPDLHAAASAVRAARRDALVADFPPAARRAISAALSRALLDVRVAQVEVDREAADAVRVVAAHVRAEMAGDRRHGGPGG